MLLRETISMTDFIDGGDYPGFGKRQIEEMAQEQFEEGKDYMHIVRQVRYIIPKGTIKVYFEEKERLALEKERSEAEAKKAAKKPVKTTGSAARKTTRK